MVASVVKGLPQLNCWNLNAECTTWHDDVKSVNLCQCVCVCVSSTVTVQVKHSETQKLQVTGLAPQHHHPRAQPPRSKCHSPGQTMDAKLGGCQAIRMCLLQLLTYPTLQRPGLPRTSKLNYLHHTSWPTWRESANPIARPGRPLRIRYLSAIQSCASTIPAAPACASIAYQSQGRLRGVSCLRNPYPACYSTIACRERTQPTITWNPSFSSKCLKYHYWQLAQIKTAVQTIDLLESTKCDSTNFWKDSPIGGRNLQESKSLWSDAGNQPTLSPLSSIQVSQLSQAASWVETKPLPGSRDIGDDETKKP